MPSFWLPTGTSHELKINLWQAGCANHRSRVRRVGDFLGGRFHTVTAGACGREGPGQSWEGLAWKLPPLSVN